jgi:hypothetical protein
MAPRGQFSMARDNRGYQPEKADRPIVRDFEAIVRS